MTGRPLAPGPGVNPSAKPPVVTETVTIDPVKAQLPLQWARGSGTATVLDIAVPSGKRLLLTAAHCTEGAPSGHVAVGTRLIPATLVARDTTADVALLEAALPGFPYAARLAARPPPSGAAVYQAGFGAPRQNRLLSGFIEGLSSTPGVNRFRLKVQAGDSGAAIVDVKSREVVGVVSGYSDKASFGGGLTPVLALVNRLGKVAGPQGAQGTAATGPSGSPAPSVIRRPLGPVTPARQPSTPAGAAPSQPAYYVPGNWTPYR